jgi:hypothetical protein
MEKRTTVTTEPLEYINFLARSVQASLDLSMFYRKTIVGEAIVASAVTIVLALARKKFRWPKAMDNVRDETNNYRDV